MLIGEVARRSGVSARMLRHYDRVGLVRPTGRTGSGYREYAPDDVRRLFHVESLRSLGLSLREVGRVLGDPAFRSPDLVDDLIRETRERIVRETELLTRLRLISAAGPADWDDVFQIVSLLQGLRSESPGLRQRAALASGSADGDPLPVRALAEAALTEGDPNVAGAIRWALAHSGDGGAGTAALLADGLESPDPAVRERAVRTLAELPGDAAASALRTALAHPDETVRGYAALALGERGTADAIPVLVDLIVSGRNDTQAADALAGLAADPASNQAAARITTALTDRLPHTGLPARRRIAQALADIPGPASTDALRALAADDDRAVALTAAYALRMRGA
ncbi:HEAT repeat domain-containing protein [Streptomyces sp. NPDC006798]|uniref:HEAT repeat domain-containing protein n=1 Tax=Streptomyces sp. NPDC006798 TaxID=3155462 RepID=UPI00340B671D